MFQIVDTHTREVVATAKTANRARQMRDKRDLQYGACRYVVRDASTVRQPLVTRFRDKTCRAITYLLLEVVDGGRAYRVQAPYGQMTVQAADVEVLI